MSNIYGANYHHKKRPSVSRQFSDNVEVPKNYPNLTPNGTLVQKQDLLASVQNLPAVLTDPKKGKRMYFSFILIEILRKERIWYLVGLKGYLKKLE